MHGVPRSLVEIEQCDSPEDKLTGRTGELMRSGHRCVTSKKIRHVDSTRLGETAETAMRQQQDTPEALQPLGCELFLINESDETEIYEGL